MLVPKMEMVELHCSSRWFVSLGKMMFEDSESPTRY